MPDQIIRGVIVQWTCYISVFFAQNFFSLTMFHGKHWFPCFSVFCNIDQSHPCWIGFSIPFSSAWLMSCIKSGCFKYSPLTYSLLEVIIITKVYQNKFSVYVHSDTTERFISHGQRFQKLKQLLISIGYGMHIILSNEVCICCSSRCTRRCWFEFDHDWF